MREFWEIRLTVASRAEMFSEILAAALDAESVSFHRNHGESDWQVSIIAGAELDEARIDRAVHEAAGVAGINPSGRMMRPLPARDWLEENRRSFPPLDVGPFHIRGSHVRTPPPASRIVLQIDAGQAFGSGTHGSTHGCLLMLEKHLGCLDKAGIRQPRIADIGCGSGILAIAAAKLRPDARIVAVDSDPDAVRVASDNARENNGAERIVCEISDGYCAELVRGGSPFDFVMANILPWPLIGMAVDAASCLAPSGRLVLSGMTKAHCGRVAACHEGEGLVLSDRISLDGWVTLVFGHAEKDA